VPIDLDGLPKPMSELQAAKPPGFSVASMWDRR